MTAWLAAVTIGAPGCFEPVKAPEPALPQAWAAGPSERIRSGDAARDETAYFHRGENVVRLHAAVNEVVAFQLVLTAGPGGAAGVELGVEELRGDGHVIPADAVRLYRFWPVRVERFPNWYLRVIGECEPADFPDALVPIHARNHGQPFTIPPNESMPLWVEIRVPADAPPGAYRTRVSMRDGAGVTSATPVEVVVRDIYFSPDAALPVLARVQLAPIVSAHTSVDVTNPRLFASDPDALRCIRAAFTLLHEHGLSPYTDEIHPDFRQNEDGTAAIDWTDYDAFCGPLIDGNAYPDGRPAVRWPVPADAGFPDPAMFDGMDSTVYAFVLRDCLTRVRAHFEERGWLDRAFVHFDLPRRPDPDRNDLAAVRRLATITDLVDRRLAFVSALIPQPMTTFGWFGHHFEDLSPLIDVWATPARYQHPSTLEYQRALGKQVWLCPDRPPFSGSLAVEAPSTDARSIPWQAFLHGHDAVQLGYTTDWPAQVLERPVSDRRRRSDRWLVYPGAFFGLDEPVPSVRLKRIQQGLQDYQYLTLLQRHGRGETARLAAGSLIKAAGTDAYGDNYQDGLFGRRVSDPEMWQLAREILAAELGAALGEGAAPDWDAAANRADWRRLLSGTRRIEAWPEYARLSMDARPHQTGYLVRFGVAVRSELRTSLHGTWKFGLLPIGWQNISDIVRVGPLPEMGFERRRLDASCADLPRCDLDGHHLQSLVFDAGTSGRVETYGVLSVVQALRAHGPIIVDGNLADWPPSASNIAGDFRLLTLPRAGEARRPRAASQTVAYLCLDAGRLLIGIQAARPKAAGGQDDGLRRFGNVVEYEDLMPVGEDLVEILIDPTNRATQNDDLFHVVVKSTGQAIFERGVGAVPPIGRCGPWVVDAEWMIESRDDRWSVELALPIDAFGPDAAENPIWGFNIARLEPVRGEYSDWAGAARYCYDPRTLGNLVFPD